jgi:hypothetical protein
VSKQKPQFLLGARVRLLKIDRETENLNFVSLFRVVHYYACDNRRIYNFISIDDLMFRSTIQT